VLKSLRQVGDEVRAHNRGGANGDQKAEPLEIPR
jgi:hypothetical protein